MKKSSQRAEGGAMCVRYVPVLKSTNLQVMWEGANCGMLKWNKHGNTTPGLHRGCNNQAVNMDKQDRAAVYIFTDFRWKAQSTEGMLSEKELYNLCCWE